MGSADGRLLLLIIDRDDDLGVKTGIKSPVIGRGANLEAALRLVMSDPEEADANSMFAGVKLYDEMRGKWSGEVELATITGAPMGGTEADMKVARELEKVLSSFKADECILITDGPIEQSLLSIISSRIKITSVRYVIVKQSQTIEQTWFLIAKYLRMVVFDPNYSRYVLGIPGLLLLVSGVLYLLNLLSAPIILAILGVVLILRGFGLDATLASMARRVYGITTRPIATQIRTFTTIASVVILISAISFGLGATSAYIAENMPNSPSFSERPEYWLGRLGLIMGVFLSSSVDLMTVAALLSASYHLFYYFYFRSPKVWRMSQAIIVFVFLWALLRALGEFLKTGETYFLIQLVLISIVGLATLATSFILIRTIRARLPDYFKKK